MLKQKSLIISDQAFLTLLESELIELALNESIHFILRDKDILEVYTRLADCKPYTSRSLLDSERALLECSLWCNILRCLREKRNS
jgi:hypothetical protein